MTNEWQTDLEDWEYVKAFQDGWEVEVLAKRFPDHEESWQAIEGRLDLFDCLRSKNNKYRTRKPAPEQSEAEKFLEKWKGQKIYYDGWGAYHWFIPTTIIDDSNGIIRGQGEDGELTEWGMANPDDWQPYTEPEELEAIPDELEFHPNNWYKDVVDKVNFLLREAKRQREAGDE